MTNLNSSSKEVNAVIPSLTTFCMWYNMGKNLSKNIRIFPLLHPSHHWEEGKGEGETVVQGGGK
jgi:hypothetical protein